MRRYLAAPLLAALALATAPANADHTTDTSGCGVAVESAGPANPHVVDPAGDWNGFLGNENIGFGDVYREGTDVRAAWIGRDASGTHAVVQVADLLDPQPNAIFYVLWKYPDDDEVAPDKTTRWVSARFRGYAAPTFTYGYQAPGTASSLQFYTEGTTTGAITPGPNGTVRIDIPLAQMGNPGAGEYLTAINAEARLLTGSPEPLPPPSPLRHGFVWVADTSEDSTLQCDARL